MNKPRWFSPLGKATEPKKKGGRKDGAIWTRWRPKEPPPTQEFE